mmetsp:Transcript_32794/g.56066  ORF Transcript_32794/g.56066 Transcript_32794/m.56066 type:complete len:427 (-) Transcript_32794:63-1343(-)
MLRISLFSLILVVCVFISFGHCQNNYNYQFLGQFEVDLPSFLNLGYFDPENRETVNNTLIITTFSGSRSVTGKIYTVENIGNQLTSVGNITPKLLTDDMIWPNEARSVPYEIFSTQTIGTGDGFLVPGKSTGSVSIIPLDTGIPHAISTPKNGWFYHVAEWWDMNGDGLMDCVSARATVPTFKPPQGELVWFENPGDNFFSTTWEEHVLASGPDIMIHLIWLDESSSQPQIVAAEFFSNEITLWWLEGNTTWSDTSAIRSRVIDSDMGAPFDVQYVDLNNDGKKDLLATNHEHAADESAVFAYEVPENWQTDPWTRHVLATNITTLKIGPNQASPGEAVAFHPNTTDTNSKAQIIVGGDGAEVAFMLYPESEDPSNWTYIREDIISTGCTVGQVAVGDVNGDSLVEFFVPAYENGIIYVYSYGENY